MKKVLSLLLYFFLSLNLFAQQTAVAAQAKSIYDNPFLYFIIALIVIFAINTVCLYFAEPFDFRLFAIVNLQENKHQCLHKICRRTLKNTNTVNIVCLHTSTRICCALTHTHCVSIHGSYHVRACCYVLP
jgi:hypothetical protein